jgi:hypothetical protein
MYRRYPIWIAIAATAAFMLASASFAARADDTKYPDWEGQWEHANPGGQYDPSKGPGRGQQPPLTAKYQAIWEANLKEAAAGGQNYNPQAHCLPGGMPRMMMGLEALEFIVTPKTTYVADSVSTEFRRIYTDGRDWPKNIDPSFAGYSIGKWSDSKGDGHYDVLDVETRGFSGPRQFDSSGIPMDDDNQTVIEERISLDQSNPNLMHDQITTIDHALTRPWAVTRDYRRVPKPIWLENNCFESNAYVFIDGKTYLVSVDGYLMPTEKNEPPPDLKYFQQPGK